MMFCFCDVLSKVTRGRPSYWLGRVANFFLLTKGIETIAASSTSVMLVLRNFAILFSLVICSFEKRNEQSVLLFFMFCPLPLTGKKVL
jgi:hypothetical protein